MYNSIIYKVTGTVCENVSFTVHVPPIVVLPVALRVPLKVVFPVAVKVPFTVVFPPLSSRRPVVPVAFHGASTKPFPPPAG